MAQHAHPRPRSRPRPRFIVVPSSSSTTSPSPSSSSSWSSWPSSGSSRRPVSSWDVWPVGIQWEEFGSLHIARCQRCADSFTSTRLSEVDAWAQAHACDPELAELLAHVTRRAA